MNTIDTIEANKNDVKAPSLMACLAKPMQCLLEQINDFSRQLQNSDDANLGHLEESLMKPTAEFLVAALQEAAQRKADAQEPKCPKCAAKLIRRQKLERAVRTGYGEIKIQRVRGWCPRCKEWFCPADLALGLEGGYSPRVREMAALFASKMPVNEASAVMERSTGIKMAPATLDRVAKDAGRKAQQLRKTKDDQARQGGEPLARQSVARAPETLVIMLDAWNIRERDDWGRSAQLRRKGQEPQRWRRT